MQCPCVCVCAGRHYRVTVFLSDIPAAVRHGGDMGAFRIRFHGADNVTEWYRLSDR